ncbi:MAG: glycosyltransferase [Phycisphaeraceae bacterium]|nr:glycosyltransferase [Phycisphaeraceae bacterium]
MALRILHISTRLILGGSQENTVLSCEGQSRSGHEVHLAFGPIFGPEGSMLDRVGTFRTDDGRAIQTHEVADLVRRISPIRDRRALGQLRALIERIDPDIVHTHSSKAGILGRLAAWRVLGSRASERRPGIVHTIHGPPFMPLDGWVLRRASIRLKNSLYAIAERRAARRCHVLVAVADAMTREFLARGIGRADQYITVRSGMEVDAFLHARPGETRREVRAGLGLSPGDLVIGTVARLAEHKGHDDLLDAIGSDLRERGAWRLLWVGDGWWRHRLEQRIASMGLTGRVVLTGLVPPERVPGLVRAMDILVHPSTREGLPRTVPQALLSGVVPVAYDVDGTREACLDGETGRLVAPGDLAGLREAILYCADHPQERRRMAETGKGRCAAAFSAERMVQSLEEVYAMALERARE